MSGEQQPPKELPCIACDFARRLGDNLSAQDKDHAMTWASGFAAGLSAMRHGRHIGFCREHGMAVQMIVATADAKQAEIDARKAGAPTPPTAGN